METIYTSAAGGGVGAWWWGVLVVIPENFRRMTEAYELALAQLKLTDRSDPLTEIVAKLIVEAARTGEKNPKAICAEALQRLNDLADENGPSAASIT